MSAIITEQFRRNTRQLLLDDIENNNYYVGIGKLNDWTEIISTQQTSPFPSGAIADQVRVKNNLIEMFRANSSIKTVIPKNIISAEKSYKIFNPYDPTCFYASDSTGEFPCFVISNTISGGNGSHIFLCLAKTVDATSANVSAEELGDIDYNSPGIYTFSDGYTWLYLGVYEVLDLINSGSFVSFNFDQNTIVESSGLIHSLSTIGGLTTNVVDGNHNINIKITGLKGSTYTVYETTATAKVLNSRITRLSLNFPTTGDINTNLFGWSQNTKVEITTTNFNSVKIAPCIAPLTDGYEKTLLNCLPSWYIGVYIDTQSAPTIPSGTSYRQISLIKNPKANDGTTALGNSDTFVNCLKYFTLSGQSTIPQSSTGIELGPNWKISQNNIEIGAIAYIKEVSGTYRYYYYSDQEVGFGTLTNSHPLTFVAPTGINSSSITTDMNPSTAQIDSPGYDGVSGEILFIDNRGSVTREEGQNEEIKIIIQL